MKKIGCKILDGLCFIADHICVIGGIALIVMMGLTAADVILRMFNKSILGNMEMIQYLMIVVIFLSFGKATFDNSFIRVEIFDFKKAEPVIKVIIDVIHVAICLIATYYCFSQGMAAKVMGTSSQMLRIVRWPFLLLSGVGFFLIAISIPLANYRNRKKLKADS